MSAIAGYQIGVYPRERTGRLAADLREVGFDVREVQSLSQDSLAVLIVDDDLQDPTFLKRLQSTRNQQSAQQIVILSPPGSARVTAEALKRGAFWVLPRTCSREELCLVLTKACVVSEVTAENLRLKSGLAAASTPRTLIAESPMMGEILAQALRIAEVDSTTLITGESGTGKSSIARVIHQHSARSQGPFISISCAAIPRDLLEAELFGHERGAFTGAVASRVGSIELADGGTLFLDEIGDLPLDLQPKLLSFLQDRTIRRVGAGQSREVDVRIITATNQDLAAMCRDKRFREELFYRLHVLSLHMPPLRARREDVTPLARSFCDTIARKRRVAPYRLTQSAITVLEAHRWPGNVRELENVIERATTFCHRGQITAADVALDVSKESAASGHSDNGGILLGTLAQIEERAIRDALERHHGDKPKAAQDLGISLKTIYNKLKRYS